jgi:SAM-dependent methyltransferase
MRARLRARAAAAGAEVEIVAGGFLTYEHAGEPPDLVYSRYALHHLPDVWKAVALARIRRMLRPGGLLRLWDVVYGFPLAEMDERVAAWCASVPESGGEGDWVRADVEEHVRDEHSTFTWLLEPMFDQAGFEVREADYPGDVDARYLLVAV